MIELLLTTFFIVVGYYAVFSRIKILFLRDKFIVVFLGTFTQIIVTEFLLGMGGWLYKETLIGLNLVLSLIFVLPIIFLKKRRKLFSESCKKDCVCLRRGCSYFFNPTNILLLSIVTYVSLWIIAAGTLLPPRGADDLAYHLPPIYQAVQKHRIELLPVGLMPHFAFPFNAELLFMWPVIFFHSQQYVDLVQIFVVLSGLPTIYALGRYIKISPPTCVFISLMFFLTPIVLMQSGSNYIDLIVSGFFLNSLYFALMFYRSQKLIYLYSCALSMGLLLGMKYGMLLAALWLQPLIIPKLYRRKDHFILYLIVIFVVGSGWYLRNLFELGTPIYNIQTVGDVSLGLIHNGDGTINFSESLHLLWKKWEKLSVQDIAASYCHGFGLAFWALSFPIWFFLFARAVLNLRKKSRTLFWIWLQLPVSLPFVLTWPFDQIQYVTRYIIYIVPIALLALGVFFELLNRNRFYVLSKIFKALCVFCGMLNASFLSVAIWPTYNLTAKAGDVFKKNERNEFRYLQDGPLYIGKNFHVWELIEDISSVALSGGLTCYLAAESGAFWTAPLYGLKLQNIIYNFERPPKALPDICFFNSFDQPPEHLVGEEINLSDVSVNIQYSLISYTFGRYVFIKNPLLKEHRIVDKIKQYYREHFGIYFDPFDAVIIEALQNIDPTIPIFVSSYGGGVLRNLELRREIKNPIYWIPKNYVDNFLERQHWPKIYSFNNSLNGYKSRPVWGTENESLVIYENVYEK